MNSLEKAILKTVIYYDIFDYPLTGFEIWKWLYDYQVTLDEVVKALENSFDLKRYLETKDGFYFFKGRKSLINTRKARRDYSIDKWRVGLRAAWFLRIIPFIKTIILCNSIAYFNAEKDSDIDFFIIVKDKYLWLTRFLITILLHFLRIRRHGNKISDRICLSFYIIDNNLSLEKLTYKRDIHFYYWLLHFVPIFDTGIYKKFFKNNAWLKNYIPRASTWEVIDNWMTKDNFFTKIFRTFLERILDNFLGRFLNSFLRKVQLFKMSKNKFSKSKENNTDVIISDNILKFHEEDNRKSIRDIFYKRISKL
ncbi:hypothetical protein K8R66_00985 [bacterium]|nr:hypothetical protein [bacterium]